MTFKTALLVLCNTTDLRKIFSIIQNEVQSCLYIQLIPEKISDIFCTDKCSAVNDKSIYKNIIHHYYECTNVSNNLDVRILLSNLKSEKFSKIFTQNIIDVVYFDNNFDSLEMKKFSSMFVGTKSELCDYILLPTSETGVSQLSFNKTEIKEYDNVVLGGTFDKLHHGHKILLTEAILRCRKKLCVGVSDNSMLKSKVLPELIDSCEYRMNHVKNLLKDLEPNLDYDIVPIYDIYGPTKYDRTLELIVATEDTITGIEKVNELRKLNQLKPLDTAIIPLLKSPTSDNTIFEDKISSSTIRIKMLGTVLSSSKVNKELKKPPYVIGLTGGIASGKSSICQYLTKLGAKCILADRIGHNVFENDSTIQSKIRERFGNSVFNSFNQIDRSKLGNIVFTDENELNFLNQLMWPAILHVARAEIDRIHQTEKINIIVLEAAVLIQASWQVYCHEIWSTIIPQHEAVRRLRERNGLTDNQALARISKQPTNEEYVKNSNVVFCSLWDKSFTENQILKAWNDLQNRI